MPSPQALAIDGFHIPEGAAAFSPAWRTCTTDTYQRRALNAGKWEWKWRAVGHDFGWCSTYNSSLQEAIRVPLHHPTTKYGGRGYIT